MARWLRGRASSAHVLALVALFVALGGGAYAAAKLPRNSVRSSTIKNGQVKASDLGKGSVGTKQLKDGGVLAADIGTGQVGTAKLAPAAVGNGQLANGAVTAGKLAPAAVGNGQLANGAVTAGKLAAGSVGAGQLAPDEPYHLIGDPGQPAFGTGSANDCLWSNIADASITPHQPFDPAGFYKGKDGVVHLTGAVMGIDGPGGDASCGGSDTAADGTIYTLPEGYRPPHLMLFPFGTNGVIVNGDITVFSGSETIPPGAVIMSGVVAGTNEIAFDGMTYRAAGPNIGIRSARSHRALHISPQVLARLGIHL